MSKGKDRQLNMEILRVVSMLMIITLHFLDKGGILKDFAEAHSLPDNLAWLIEAFCMVSVNLYVLISGYFLCKSTFKLKKSVMLWIQILLYSWIIFAVFAIVKRGSLSFENGIYDIIPLILPVTGNHYWFATIYMLLYLFFPFINMGIDAMDKNMHKKACILLLVVFSVWNTVLPFTIPVTDHEGMDICWFVVLYVIAAFIRKYPEEIKGSKFKYLAIYIACPVLIFAFGKGLIFADSFLGKLGGYATNFYPYNSFFTAIGSIALFIFFAKSEIKAKGFVSKVILFMSAGTFGVYLIHEHRLMRYEWPKWLNTSAHSGKLTFIPYGILCILIVFAAGIIIDGLRRLIVNLFDKKPGLEEKHD